ncbi:FAD:protein FMN transferase [Acidiferrimicrobium sp. IK]|uniref:FAD:protein FMN transferase n=1 Tax=Acidiferrimicrobium sp. IK TaxID=2871700 RepID=UPI0021CB8E2D|nr:FAD:protein FMN transferase [Acidiferrimicrobium sp. IK]MCU4186520.1 FAD:protein FMN transferase [Acidiferrimicrobium sp. IK]
MRPALLAVARYECQAIGTGCVLAVAGEDPIRPELTVILHRELERVDLLASRFRDDSELTALNRSPQPTVAVSAGLFDLIAAALWAAEATHGAADPTVGRAVVAAGYDRDFASVPAVRPGRISPVASPGWASLRLDPDALTVTRPPGTAVDLGATAKAVTADRCARAVADASGLPTLVSLGGDISVAGPVPDEGWSVGIAEQWWADAPDRIALRTGGVATSSTTARQWRIGDRDAHHIIDPATGRPADGPWRSATVVAADCLQANAASTAAIVKGSGALTWLESLDVPARLVGHDGQVAVTDAWPRADAPRQATPC